MATPPRAVYLASGGPDSVVAAALARREGFQLFAMFVDYRQHAARREEECAGATAAWLGALEFRKAELPWLGSLGGSALTEAGGRVTRRNPAAEYVPFRNTVMISLAVAWAEVVGAGRVVVGSTGGPWITPDNKPEYYDAVDRVIALGARAGTAISTYAPLCRAPKTDAVRKGLELGIPFEDTWSCHNEVTLPCGECTNCLDRERSFAQLGVDDPLIQV
jgi:7-cyano-7-deazaguanine synthase